MNEIFTLKVIQLIGTENFSENSVNNTSPVTYCLEDENKEIIQGKYYEQELLRSDFSFKSISKTLESMNMFHQLEKNF